MAPANDPLQVFTTPQNHEVSLDEVERILI
jgi:hypothetical protein